MRKGWEYIRHWTFHTKTKRQMRRDGGFGNRGWSWGPRNPAGYSYPDDPSLMGEVLLRSFSEGA